MSEWTDRDKGTTSDKDENRRMHSDRNGHHEPGLFGRS